MNRKKGIIIGTTGIIIVALALIGFTYGFYLSLISGNESSKKVKVTAGKSKLEYVELSTEVDTIIGPGYTNTKYFAVQNVGDISGSYYLYLVDVENTFNRKNDIVYTIYRKAYDYSEENVEPEEFDINGTYDFSSWENVTNSHCKTVSEFTDYGDCQYPSEKSQLSTQKQTIMEKDDYYVYAFVVTYINQPEIDQIADEESVFSGVVKVYADETGTDVSPFMPGTLADAIYMSALNETNGTAFVNTPLTNPAETISGVTNYKTTGEDATYASSMSSVSSNASKTWYYYDTYEVDTTTGKFTLSGKQSCTYSSCYSNLVGKYLYNTSASYNSNANNHTATTKTNLSNIYKVVEATSSSLNYVQVFNSPNEAERVLAPTTDDYGTSYYYRGDVEDNYVNFAGMCWRIVRIEGDGSVKLILEDKDVECNNSSFTGNWSDGNIYVFGYDNNGRADFLNYTGGLADSFKTFQTTLAKKMDSSIGDTPTNEQVNNTLANKLKIDEWCYDDNITEYKHYDSGYNSVPNPVDGGSTDEYYGAYTRIYTNKKPSFSCSGTKLTKFKDNTNMYVATLTADEMSFAGASGSTNYNYYLMNSYAKDNYLYWWSLSPFSFFEEGGHGNAFFLGVDGCMGYNLVVTDFYSRPAVSLKSGSVITEGEGTLEKPYIIG